MGKALKRKVFKPFILIYDMTNKIIQMIREFWPAPITGIGFGLTLVSWALDKEVLMIIGLSLFIIGASGLILEMMPERGKV